MNKDKIIDFLKDENEEHVEKYASYCVGLSLATDRTGKLKNYWITKVPEQQLANYFKRVSADGLVLDGVHVTLQSTGISYDYVAYKNKMFIAYPESTVDVSLVYEGDEFSFGKEDGKVNYKHSINNPFAQTAKDIIGAYCIIKNKRGEFITLLSKEELDKHRKVAKTDYIWAMWTKEMSLKTVIKKACKQHFADTFQAIEKTDNGNYELENPLELELEYKQAMDKIETIEELSKYYQENKGKGKEFDKYVSIRKKQINENL